MHDDATVPENAAAWGPYLSELRRSGQFDGGSSIGTGHGHRRTGCPGLVSNHLVGYLLIDAHDSASAESYLVGNPVYEAGGTVEIRELLED
jgi:hypothetical protein